MLAALAGLAVAIGGALLLFPIYGHVGVAAAIAAAGWVGAILLGIVLARRRWLAGDRDLGRRLAGIVLAAVAMDAVLVALRWLLPFPDGTIARLGVLAILVATGLATYAVALQVFGVTRLSALLAAINERA
jgi:putative peptidoglycan lipid II flippase